MKKALITLLAVIAMFAVQAQTNKGRMFAGGNLHYNRSSSTHNDVKEPNFVSFSVSPQFGYFLTDKVALGTSFEYNLQKSDYDSAKSEFIRVANSYKPKIFGRYYGSIAGNFGYFIHGEAVYGFSKSEAYDTLTYKNSSISFGLKPGLYYFITPKFCIESSLGGFSYSSGKRTDKLWGVESKSQSFDFIGNFSSIYLGLNIFF